MNQVSGECTLKYLGFFPAALSSVCVYLSAVYEAAKDQAGPLRPGVEDVEEVLKVVVRPVLRIAENQSAKLLDYVDKKVDEKLKMVEDHIPSFIKPIAFYAQKMIGRAEPTKSLNVRSVGLESPASSHGVAYSKEAYSEYWTYDNLEKFIAALHLRGVVSMLGPSAVCSAQLFNQFASSLREARIPFSSYVPDVPVQVLEHALKVSRTDASWPTWQVYECEGAC
ncbi:hypothetical protein GOP47_0000784 [Adiantum capillus-veneris]|uniref:Uncharacterized protein n=1 Tax=Adiantum capillus-veneris TaxID=13818 RepID=A0A9D4VDM9_ADICA|nr:hypothetical protein GOP47_0000784 [Adiantum capillus-veneris]